MPSAYIGRYENGQPIGPATAPSGLASCVRRDARARG
jgi:hypothetical protein